MPVPFLYRLSRQMSFIRLGLSMKFGGGQPEIPSAITKIQIMNEKKISHSDMAIFQTLGLSTPSVASASRSSRRDFHINPKNTANAITGPSPANPNQRGSFEIVPVWKRIASEKNKLISKPARKKVTAARMCDFISFIGKNPTRASANPVITPRSSPLCPETGQNQPKQRGLQSPRTNRSGSLKD